MVLSPINSEKYIISYRNQGYSEGYAEGYASGINNTGSISYTYHSHNEGCYTLYSNGNCSSCSKAGGSYPVNKTPTQCGNCGASYSWTTFSTSNKLTCGKTTSTIESAIITFE